MTTTPMSPDMQERVRLANERARAQRRKRKTRYTDRRSYALAKNGRRALLASGALALTFLAMLGGSSGSVFDVHLYALAAVAGTAGLGVACFIVAWSIEERLAKYDAEVEQWRQFQAGLEAERKRRQQAADAAAIDEVIEGTEAPPELPPAPEPAYVEPVPEPVES